jgi:hypothetical protein
MTKETIPSCFAIGYTKYRFIRVENDTVKCMLIKGDLNFIYLPLSEVLAKAKEIPEPEQEENPF